MHASRRVRALKVIYSGAQTSVLPGLLFFRLRMTQICSNCQAPNRVPARFCRACGQPLGLASNENLPWLSQEPGAEKRPAESAVSTVQASMEVATSRLMWPDQPQGNAGTVASLPPPFGLPNREPSALHPGDAISGSLTGASAKANRFVIRPLGVLAAIVMLVLLAAGFWLVQTSSTAEIPSDKAVSATTPPAVAASGSAPIIETTALSQPPINETPAAPPAAEPPAMPQQVTPLLVQRPAPNKVEPKAPVAKLSIPALPAPAAASKEGPATTTTNAAAAPNAELAIPPGPLSPRDACSSVGASGQAACLDQQCAKPALQQHSQCQRLRKEREQEVQRLYSGS